MAPVNPVGRSSCGGGDRRKPAWMLGFSRKRTNLHEKYDYPEYGVKLVSWDELPKASALVAAVAHDEYREMGTARLLERLAPGGVFVDVKGTHDRATIEAAGRYVWRL
ncbi:MAG: hypothetical protein AB7U92_03940 [Piscinibacter sp.]|uniref:hypothetical protein n=1 Tax=Piscinibacter sp. TaxID=1903157 RepID=UPI003D0F9C37